MDILATADTAPANGDADLPEICVLIPVWNDQAGLLRTLQSLAGETTPFDIVVVDDGSREAITCDPAYGSHAVTLLRLPQNRGIEHALNAGLEHILARGYPLVARLDCGDLPMPGRLARQAEYLHAHPTVGIVGTWARCVDDDGTYLFTLRFPSEHAAMLRRQRYVPALLHPTVMMRTAALREVGLYSDQFKTAEDYELFARIGRSWQLANIPEPLTEYIVSAGGTTALRRRRTLQSRLKVQRQNFAWSDPHAYLGVGQTLAFMAIPFSWVVWVKQKLWR